MQQSIVIIGIGEMAGVFARGFLRAGYPVIPVTRTANIAEIAVQTPQPALVLVAVTENDLHTVLEKMPLQWQKNLALLQNELLPKDWQRHALVDPTIISVWFEKKKGMDFKVIIPSPVYGPNAKLVSEALGTLSIPCNIIQHTNELLYELVRKNVYILTTNIAGLRTGGNVSTLWEKHESFARDVAAEVIAIQEWLSDTTLDHQQLINGMLEAFEGDPDHSCTGRSAPARLQRIMQQARAADIAVPTLDKIHAQIK